MSSDNVQYVQPKYMTHDSDTTFVYEQSVRADMDTLNSIRKSIASERRKSGILLGFFTLVSIESIEYFNILPLWLKCTCSIAIVYVLYLLICTFCSTKMDDGVNTKNIFLDGESWKGRREQFLLYHHQILRNNIEDQKVILTALSKSIRRAAVLLGIVVMVVFLYYTIPAMRIFLDGDASAEQNPLQPEVYEAAEHPGNPILPEKIDKSA